MYINLSKTKQNFRRGDLELLVAIKQVNTEYLIIEMSENDLMQFEDLNFISRVKVKKKDEHPYKCLRLSETASRLLIEASYEGSADEESKTIAEWVIKIYKNKSGGIVKNKTEILRRLHWFKNATNITGNKLAILTQCFMEDTYDPSSGESVKDFMDSNSRGVLSNMADNIFWAPTSLYDKHKTLDKSPLYIYYEDNEDYIKQVWRDKLTE